MLQIWSMFSPKLKSMILLKQLFRLRIPRQTFWFATKAQQLVKQTVTELQESLKAKKGNIPDLLAQSANKVQNVPAKDKQMLYKIFIFLTKNKKIPSNDMIDFGEKHFVDFPHLQIEMLTLKAVESKDINEVEKLIDLSSKKLQEIKDPDTKDYYEQQIQQKLAEIYFFQKKYDKALIHFTKTLDGLTKMLKGSVQKYSKRIQDLSTDPNQSETLQIEVNGLKTLLKTQIQTIGGVSRQAFRVAEIEKKQQQALKFLKTGLDTFNLFPNLKEGSTDYLHLNSTKLFLTLSLQKNPGKEFEEELTKMIDMSTKAIKTLPSPYQKLDAGVCGMRCMRILLVVQGKRNQIKEQLQNFFTETKKNITENDWKLIGSPLEKSLQNFIKAESGASKEENTEKQKKN